MGKSIANIITSLRIIFSIIMMFFPVFSPQFYIIYLFCRFSDMIDGMVARRTKSNSGFGAVLDTIADFTFIATFSAIQECYIIRTKYKNYMLKIRS